MAGNPNYETALLTTTLELFLKNKALDVIFEDNALFDALKARAKTTKSGGVKLLVPLMYGANTTVGSFSGYDAIDISPQEGMTNAEYEWRQYAGALAISNRELEINSGEPAKINLLKAKWEQLRMSFRDVMNAHLYLDGAGNGGKDILGLALLVDSAGTVGNIARSTNTWWSSQEIAVAGPLQVGGSTGMIRLHNDCAFGQGKRQPNLIITTQAIFEDYESQMLPYMRYSVGGEASAAFAKDNLMFRKSPIFWDADCQSGVLYMLNTDFLEFVTMEGQDFKVGAFQEPVNQDAKVAKITFMGQFVVSNARHQGKLTGIS